MKKLLITCGFIFSCCAVNAQWYTPITRESNNSNNQQAQSQQQIRTITAYCIDRSTGGCYKAPIKVSIENTICVVAIYKSSAVVAMWEKVGTVPVYKCSGSTYDEFESRFSYKAIILNKTYYFDL